MGSVVSEEVQRDLTLPLHAHTEARPGADTVTS